MVSHVYKNQIQKHFVPDVNWLSLKEIVCRIFELIKLRTALSIMMSVSDACCRNWCI